MMPEPGDYRAPRPAVRGRLRASHADREQVIDTLKDAFVQGRLTKEELDSRVGDVLASRTYADLTALTADLPSGPSAPQRSRKPTAAGPRRPPNKAVKNGARVITAATVLAGAAWVGALLSNTDNQVVGALVMSLTVVWFGIVLMAGAIMIESRHQPRSDRQLPPTRGQGSRRTISTDPAGWLRPGDYRGRHAAEASPRPLPPPRPTGYVSHWTPATAALG